MSLTAKVILIFTVFAVVAGGTLYFIYYQSKQAKGLDLELTGPDKVSIGVPFDVQVNVSNTSDAALQDVRLSMTLPEGLAFVGSSATKNIDYKTVPGLGAGSLTQQVFKLVALNGDNTFKQIIADATYISGSLSSRFQKEKTLDLAVSGYAITIDLATPQKIFSGEAFDTQVTYKNVSDGDFDNLKLQVDYPPAFNVLKSSLNPDTGNNIWVLGGLRKGSEGKIKINGKLIGPDGAAFDIKATIQETIDGQAYPISVNSAALSIATSPVSIRLSLNDRADYVSHSDDALNYKIDYVNNTDVGLRDVIIKAQMISPMFDFSQIDTRGNFRSSDNTIIWNASNSSDLAALSPGASGQVFFNLKTKKDYPIRRLSDSNFLLKVTATIESPTVPNFVAADKTFSITSLENKVGGKANLDTKIYFRDAATGILNSGPFPPKANKKTNYTVHWQITNYSTDLTGVDVKAFLAANVRFTGVSKSFGTSALPAYNSRTQEVTWHLDRVPATAGVISKPIETVFQIEATPSSTDIGRFMDLIQESSLTANDAFTSTTISVSSARQGTQLFADPTAGNTGVVQQ